ncbi:M36 family metallopeptidase [Nevskia sp.]|uniref:M36 family metallopeptidase n=1 Tax=Nevskia sp. TaxID=1929292 RepID=UPI0025DED159|nr:M36 family metallopeptidase [Nevskia sp.]
MIRLIVAAAGAFAVVGSAAAAGALSSLANHDASFAAPNSLSDRGLRAVEIARAAPRRAGLASTVDATLGAASFLWGAEGSTPAAVGALSRPALAMARARDYASRQAALLGIGGKAIEQASARLVHDAVGGASIVRLQQSIAGVDVFNRQLNVMIGSKGEHIATSGYFAPQTATASTHRLGAAQAIAAAVADVGGSVLPAALSLSRREGAYELFNRPAAGALSLTRDPRAKKVWFPMADRLVAGWYVEVIGAGGDGETSAYSTVISAENGAVLFRKSLVEQAAYSYRVFADAAGIQQPFDAPIGNGYAPFPGATPAVVQPRVSAVANLVTLSSGPISTNDPWLPAGATTTTGNNTDAYLDNGLLFGAPITAAITDGYQPRTNDVRATLTAPGTFDHAIVADADPAGATTRQAAIVNLFYVNNWLHDIYYDRGLNEAAGNAQTVNYGRGGEEGDAILAEGQDASGRNNANMLTPADGGSPRMQMYLFDGPITGSVNVTAPAAGPGLVFSTASFGPQVFDVTAPIAAASERAGVSPTDGCAGGQALPITGTTLPALPDRNLRGRIALIDRGNCSFTTKEQFAMASGAVGMIVINNDPVADPTPMGNADLPQLPINLPLPSSTDGLYRLPAVMIRNDAGVALRAQLAAGNAVSMRLNRAPSIDYDGTLDNQIIVHEFFHYVSNRLVGDASGLSNSQGRGMGEGWSDFAALMLTVRPDDLAVPGNAGYSGAYPLAYYSTASFNAAYQYFGIRRQPYSRSFAFNSLTFQHIQNGVPLPNTAPVAFGADGATNAAVHSTGEIWSNMLWEGYSNMLNSGRYSLPEARSRMMDYVIGGLKMTPNAPTILEARDAVLAAAMASSQADYLDLIRGFAKRGAGVGAVGPARNSTDHVGVVESYIAP